MPTPRMSMRKLKAVLRLKRARGLTTGRSAGPSASASARCRRLLLRRRRQDLIEQRPKRCQTTSWTRASACGDHSLGSSIPAHRARLPRTAPRSAPQLRHAATALGGIRPRQSRPADLSLHAVLPEVQGLVGLAHALDATEALRRRESVRRLRRAQRADPRAQRRRIPDPRVRRRARCSNNTFACATQSEAMADWIGDLCDALAFIGGVPELLVPATGCRTS